MRNVLSVFDDFVMLTLKGLKRANFSKMKTSATVTIIELPILPLKVFIALHLQIERNPTLKKCKKLSLKNSDMQKVKMYFLRVMKEYGKNEEGKKYGQKKNTKPPEHADRG